MRLHDWLVRRGRAKPQPTLFGPQPVARVTVAVRVLDIGDDWVSLNVGTPGTVGVQVTLSEDDVMNFESTGHSFGGQ